MKLTSPRAAVAFAFVLPALPAAALTPEEAWASWQSLVTASGQTLTTTSIAREGDTLTVTGIATSMSLPDAPTIAATIPQIAFRDRGDGSVEIIYPPTYDTTFTFPESNAEAPQSFVLTFTHDQLSIIASGDAASPRIDATAVSATAIGKDFVHRDGTPVDITAVATMSGLSASYTIASSGSALAYDTTTTAKTFAIAVDGNSPKMNSTFKGALSITDLNIIAKSAGLDTALMQTDMAAALAAGLSVDASFTSGPIGFTLDMVDKGKPGTATASLASTSFSALLNKDQIDYGYALIGGTFTGSGFDMPFPMISTSFAEISQHFAFPASKSDTPRPFGMSMKLVDLTVIEDVWALFDPGKQLPRDPVTFIVDLAGTGAWAVDILDPAAQMENGPDLPAKLFTLDLTQVLAKAAGAQIAATGGLTFDNANLQPYGGFPAPLGKITFTLTGINALLDALVVIGLVPEQDLMSVRMGLAMMARPGAGPDELISEVEFREGGSLFVNGQQMQ